MLSLSELIQYVPGSACSIKCFQLAVPLLKKVRQNEISEEIYTSLHRKAESLAAIGVPGTHKCQALVTKIGATELLQHLSNFSFTSQEEMDTDITVESSERLLKVAAWKFQHSFFRVFILETS